MGLTGWWDEEIKDGIRRKSREVGKTAQKGGKKRVRWEGREGGREGQTDGGVGPQRRVIHHTTMQPALVLYLFPCRSFISSSSLYSIFFLHSFTSSFHLFPCPHTLQSLWDFHIISLLPLVCRQLLNNLPSISSHHLLRRIALLLPLALIFRFHHLLWQQSSFLLSIFSPLSGVHPKFFRFSTLKQRQYPSFSVHFTKGSDGKKCGWKDDRW